MIEISCAPGVLSVTQNQAKVLNMFGLIYYDRVTEEFAAYAGVSKTALETFLRIWGE